ncbi:MAG: HXXEE domain-containing protein [Gemmatimonadaceae bacterium]|nr:HXXEE domain-containing protein [Gemmatimonadaceae bacterium]
MNRSAVMWTVPLLLTLHNAEEAVTFPRYLPQVRDHAPYFMRSIASADPSALFFALLVVTVVPALISLWGWMRPDSRAAFWSVLLIQATVFLNVFAHLSSAVALFRGYGPGLLTALAVNLPFSVYLFCTGRRNTWLTRKETIWLVPAALLVHGPGLIAAFAIGKALG